jgi:nucleoside-diphosphate-sugar epimerase
MYGVSTAEKELEEESSEKNPVTTYAKTKWQAEVELKELGDNQFIVSCFRPSTVFGVSPNLRCDIIFNNLVACAYTSGRVEIKSDGSPWRPVVHVRDVVNALIAGLEAPAGLVGNQSFNVGIENGNYRVRELAEAAQRAVPGAKIVYTGEHTGDVRTYRVSFKKILSQLSPYYSPKWGLDEGGRELVEFFRRVNLTEDMFRGRMCNRLQQLKHLIGLEKLDDRLYWRN